MIKIIVDAMGGDNAPYSSVAGAVAASQKDKELYIIFTGRKAEVEAELQKHSYDKARFEPQEYYCKLPEGIEHKTVFLVDPMLATGGSACDALNALKKRGCKNIKFMAIIAAPQGVENVAKSHPDVPVYVSTLDRCLNENGYILPGLGDAGDRLFGTK